MRLLKPIIFLFLTFFCISCSPSKKELSNIKLLTLTEQTFYLNHLNPKMIVLFFLSPECPLCENYSTEINTLYSTYKDVFSFYAIFPGEHYPQEKIELFKENYQLKLPVLLDKKLELTKLIKASITPEVFVLDSHHHILYHGAIDNRAISLGKKRTQITQHYLIDALEKINHDKSPEINHTKAVGCYIEYEY